MLINTELCNRCHLNRPAEVDEVWCIDCLHEVTGPMEDDHLEAEYEDRLLPGEDMDGDHDSAMSSAGWGTDEDYGYYGGDDGF